MIQRLSIILLILVALATPAAAGTAAFSLFVYFENFSDQPATFTKTDSASSLDTASDKCPNLKIKYKDGSIAGDIINAASKATGVEAAQIAAQIEIESSFDQFIFSKDSTASEGKDDPIAYGLMQTTAPTYNSKIIKTQYSNLKVTYSPKIKHLSNGNPYTIFVVTGKNYILDNPAAAVLAGAWYYRDQLDEFKDPDIAVAAYNAGPVPIRKSGWIKGKPMPKLFDQTMEHVKKFDVALAKYRGCQSKKVATGKKIYLHWTAGVNTLAYDEYSYNIVLDNKGKAKSVKTNGSNHTQGRNSDSFGIAIAAMGGCGDSNQYHDILAASYRNCQYPPTQSQIDAMVQQAAELAVANNIPVDQDHIMSHGEAGSLMDYPVEIVQEAMKKCGNADSTTTDACFQTFGLPTNNYGPYRGGTGTRWEFQGQENQIRSLIQAKVTQLQK